MTRIAAAVLSMFGPVLLSSLLVLFFVALDHKPPTVVGMIGVGLLVIGALTMRVYFAIWYVRDKGRSSALGLIALFGLLGWLFLFMTEDRKHVVPAEVPATDPSAVAPH